MRTYDGAWIGWTGSAEKDPDPFIDNGLSLVPVPLSDEEIELYYEGFSNASLWPLYHDVIVAPEFHREWWDAYVEVNDASPPEPPKSPPQTQWSGYTTTSCSSYRQCCASIALTCASASSCTFRSRPRSSSCGCRGAGAPRRAARI
jgi:hypothetical protein